jgi:pimeloyl-ACP methyl ester carboxylesterase
VDGTCHKLLRRALQLVAGFAALAALPASAQLKTDVVFTEYSPLSITAEMVRRFYSPLTALRINQEAQRAGHTLRGQPIDLAKEHYAVYVPDHPHALLVFIPPWPRAEVPRQWIPALNRYNTILVTAANSGNEAPTTDRREPLALLAVHNIMAQYPVDPQQVYIGGFSGGARVALRLALGYPDVFHGALLNAGSDLIGTADVPLPPADLFRRLQESTRLVYLTGERDEENLSRDTHSQRSLDKWCVYDVVVQTVPRTEHELADVSSFSRALQALPGRGHSDPDKLEKCRARIDQELKAALEQVENAFARGDSTGARKLLSQVDVQYGGLAAPRSVELATQEPTPRN